MRTPLRVLALLTLAVARVGATPPGSPEAVEALKLCAHADGLAPELRAANLARARTLADQVLAANPRDARAHFVLVCTIGKDMQDQGIGISQFFALRHLRRELDTTLELAPDDPDALAAKGALLFSVPRILGGDPVEAERLLRRALTADPDNDDARCYLSRALIARGAESEARALDAHC